MKKFLVTKVRPLNYFLSSDDVQFLKDSDVHNGTVFIDASGLSLSLTFELSKVEFSKKTIAMEEFSLASFGTRSSCFEYVFDNDEMLAQFCEFYGLER